MTTIDAATARDIPAIMRLERGAGFEHLVGRWSAEQHAAEMALPGSHYLLAQEAEGRTRGFLLLQRLDDPDLCAHLRRIAVAQPGEGLGTVLLEAALTHVFGTTHAHRFQLHVYVDNERARRVYARAGFIEDGILRDARRMPDGAFKSTRVMSILRPEWEAMQRQT